VAVTTASVVPAIERWGVLVTNLGATVATIFGALYVSILSNPCPPFEFFSSRDFEITTIPHVVLRWSVTPC
jgi:hypothetical protein